MLFPETAKPQCWPAMRELFNQLDSRLRGNDGLMNNPGLFGWHPVPETVSIRKNLAALHCAMEET